MRLHFLKKRYKTKITDFSKISDATSHEVAPYQSNTYAHKSHIQLNPQLSTTDVGGSGLCIRSFSR